MNVLVTGSYGRCGTAIIDHLHDRDDYEFTYFNRSDRPADHPYGSYDTVVGDVGNEAEVRAAMAGHDAVVHLAAYPYTEGTWGDVREPNVDGMYNVLEAALETEVETFVFGSTNHVMGGYEREHAPDIYELGHGIVLDHTDPVRPDSYYGTTKAFGENLGRQYVECDRVAYPKRFYALRICTVNDAPYDHPYGDAESGVNAGTWERGSTEYDRAVSRMKAMWQSRRDFAHMIDCCLRDKTVEFDVFYGVSDNRRRWFDIEHARTRIGYRPKDDGETWNEPPSQEEPDR